MVNTLTNVDSSILDCKKSIEEFDNAILNIHTEVFNRIQNQFSSFNDELSNLVGLIDDLDVATKDNKWTSDGLTQLGLLAQQYELASYQVEQYNTEIEELNKQYLAGRYSATEYADKLIELKNSQWDAVNAAESAKDAIMDVNKARVEIVVKGIEEEIEKYKELTDAAIEALDAEKDLHNYEKSIAEKTKTISDLQRQIAAMRNDTTASTIAKRKKLEEELAKAIEDLHETEYDHSIEAQKDALQKQFEDYQDTREKEIEELEATLEDRESILYESFESVKANAAIIGEEIEQIASVHDILRHILLVFPIICIFAHP